MTEIPQTILAFDFGTKRIGVAVGQQIAHTATELATIKAQEGIPDWQQLEQLFNEWLPTSVIVGLPLNMDGTEQEMTRRARKFGNRLRARFKLPVEFLDERLTTFEAKNISQSQGHNGNFQSDPIDSLAATVLLRDYWNTEISNSNN